MKIRRSNPAGFLVSNAESANTPNHWTRSSPLKCDGMAACRINQF
jgi:hypothetical protein